MKAVARPVIFTHELKADANGDLPTTIELATTGEWQTPYHGDFRLSATDFAEAVNNFDSGAYRVRKTGSLPAGLDHFTGAAAYWIDRLYTQPRDDGETALMADITWSALGREKMQRDEYRYTSMEYNHKGIPLENPERKGEFLVNVLTGSTLTNDPLFKEKLKPVMASARTGSDNNNKGEAMTLEDVRAKKPEELTDAEKQFLADHKADLTDEERKTFSLEEAAATTNGGEQNQGTTTDPKNTTSNGGVQASAHTVTMSQTEIEQLRADAKAGREAQTALHRAEIRKGLEAHARDGKVKTDEIDNLTDFMMTLSSAQRDKMSAVFSAIPKNPLLSGEQGHAQDLKASVTVTDDEKKVAGSFGNTAEDIENFKKAEAERN